MKKLVVMFAIGIVLMTMSSGCVCEAYDRTLTKEQKEIAETVYSVCAENYDEYGVLPSVCLVQAFIESTMGEHCSGFNLWGIASGAESYDSLEEGALRYLKVINNGYYKGAPFEKDRYVQLRRILDGGYCQPEGEYYANSCWVWRHYDLAKYDRRMWKKRKKARKLEKKKKEKKEKLRKARFKEKFIREYKSKVIQSVAGVNAEMLRQMEAKFEYERLY